MFCWLFSIIRLAIFTPLSLPLLSLFFLPLIPFCVFFPCFLCLPFFIFSFRSLFLPKGNGNFSFNLFYSDIMTGSTYTYTASDCLAIIASTKAGNQRRTKCANVTENNPYASVHWETSSASVCVCDYIQYICINVFTCSSLPSVRCHFKYGLPANRRGNGVNKPG